jgi:hypothetical protein
LLGCRNIAVSSRNVLTSGSPEPIDTKENVPDVLMVTDVKVSFRNRRLDGVGRFSVLERGLRSGDTECGSADKDHRDGNRYDDKLADATWHGRLPGWTECLQVK